MKSDQMNSSIISSFILKFSQVGLPIYTRNSIWETRDMSSIHRSISFGLIIHPETVEWPAKFLIMDLVEIGVARWMICFFFVSDLCSPSEIRSRSLSLFRLGSRNLLMWILSSTRFLPKWSHLPVRFVTRVTRTNCNLVITALLSVLRRRI